MKNLIEIIREVASIPSYTNHEELLHPYIENFLDEFVPNHTITKVGNGLVIEVPGSLADEPIALAAHLDKINHDKIPMFSDFSLCYAENDDTIIGHLDDSVGVGMCLYLAAWAQENVTPPLLLLLSDREEIGCLGAADIVDYLYKRFDNHDKFLYPKWIINIDLSERVPEEIGVGIYSDDNNEIADIVNTYFDVFDAEGLNDYTIYEKFLWKTGSTSVVSINPRCENLHSVKETVKKTDIEKVSNIVKFLLDFSKRKCYN